MKVTVDADRCRGHGVCCALCPEIFGLTEDGYATALVVEVGQELVDAVQEAVRQCPEKAILAS